MRNRSENQITLVLIRHGATRSNQEHRYLGKTEEALSEAGRMQLEEDKGSGLFPELDFLFASPKKRCIQTAELLYPEKAPILIPEWEEIDFGAFEGKNYKELQGDKRYQEWIDSNGILPFPEGEGREEFVQRCRRGFEKMTKRIKATQKEVPETIGMIVHGGTIMALLSGYGGGNYFDYQTANGRGYICTMKNFDTEPEVTELKKIGRERIEHEIS